MVIDWLSCDKELPCDREKVLIIHNYEIKTATFEKGITVEEREKMIKGEIPNPVKREDLFLDERIIFRRSDIIKGGDVHDNNLVPYCWYLEGHKLFGQKVDFWAHFPDIEEFKKPNKQTKQEFKKSNNESKEDNFPDCYRPKYEKPITPEDICTPECMLAVMFSFAFSGYLKNDDEDNKK